MEIKRLKRKLAQLERKHARTKGVVPRARIEKSINATEIRKAMLERG